MHLSAAVCRLVRNGVEIDMERAAFQRCSEGWSGAASDLTRAAQRNRGHLCLHPFPVLPLRLLRRVTTSKKTITISVAVSHRGKGAVLGHKAEGKAKKRE